ncbi:hypothetical protein D2T29_12845 [Sinirhodobacter populi]|uniref:Type IV conjugative transfer system protein TraV n=1 Tax=Paenirhodobacter populi TaxID=2306993 RepID=A0A443KD81_9RHOB|nr:hypothetical protein [Sinirhodobacter populi]RWR30553.1 hypothetical protein D2T29_12845 [Sinirhodobacter populi]
MQAKIFASIALVSALSSCGASLAPGEDKGICETNPDRCASVRQAKKDSDGPVLPKPSDAALQRGDSMRVWVAPMRTPSGVLTNSGYIYVE